MRPWHAMLAAALLAAPAHAQTWVRGAVPLPLPPGTEVRTERWPVGPGMHAEKLFACGGVWRPGVGCQFLGWRAVGFTFGQRRELVNALTFSGDGRGRVLASTSADVLYSDDRGATWQRAAWDGVNKPQVIAMDPETRFGVAAAEGAVHVTDDGGASWRFLREVPARRIVQAVVAGRNGALADARGGAWAVVRGGDFEVLSDAYATTWPLPGAQLRVEGADLVAVGGDGRAARVRPSGDIERVTLTR